MHNKKIKRPNPFPDYTRREQRMIDDKLWEIQTRSRRNINGPPKINMRTINYLERKQ